jgi:hypothetical protein
MPVSATEKLLPFAALVMDTLTVLGVVSPSFQVAAPLVAT